MHLRPFGCLTELSANRDELVQKFVPRSHVGIFRNNRTRSTPLDPKLMFCYDRTRSTPLDPKLMFSAIRTISVHFGPFGCLTNIGAKRAELVQMFMPRSRVGIFHDERA